MAKLSAAERHKIPTKEFGLPKERKYPMENRAHAVNAEARATQMEKRGKLSAAAADRIKSKARRMLNEG